MTKNVQDTFLVTKFTLISIILQGIQHQIGSFKPLNCDFRD